MQTVAKVCSIVRDGVVVLGAVALLFGAAVAGAQAAPTPASPDPAPPAEAAPPSGETATDAPAEPVPEAEPTETAPAEPERAEPLPEAAAEPLTEVTSPAPAPPVEPPSRVPSYVMWGLGGASLVLGTVYGVMALQAKNDFDDQPTFDGADKTEERAIVADVALGAGLILAITGTVFYFVRDEPRAEKSAASKSTKQRLVRNDLRVAPYVGARSGGGTLSLRF